MSGERTPLLVLGLGNLLCGDDGAGVEAVTRLAARWSMPEGVQVLDGGTLGLSLLAYLCSAERAILVDAVIVDEPPGTIVRFDGDEVVSAAHARMSCHQIGVADVLECARILGEMPVVTLIGIAAADVSALSEPTAAVIASIDSLVDRVVAELRAHGYAPTLRGPSTVVSADAAEESPHERWTGDSPYRRRARAGAGAGL